MLLTSSSHRQRQAAERYFTQMYYYRLSYTFLRFMLYYGKDIINGPMTPILEQKHIEVLYVSVTIDYY